MRSPYRSGRSPDWLKMKNLDAPAVKREAEEDWGRLARNAGTPRSDGEDKPPAGRAVVSLDYVLRPASFIGTHNVCSSLSVPVGFTASRGLNRQSCDRDHNSRKEPADAEEHQNIVDFGHGIFPLRW